MLLKAKKGLDILLKELGKIHSDFKLIPADKIEVAEWVRWKCLYGCRAYGKHLSCPPHVPSVKEAIKLIQCYGKAIVARFDVKPNLRVPPSHIHHYLWDAIKEQHDTMCELERYAFVSGYYKAFAMGALPCSYCEDCLPERAGFDLDPASKRFCEQQHKVRPSMEAWGIDVFKTVRTAGYEVEVLTSFDAKITFFGLLLLE
jgi:predicted metal-binding protein